MENGPFIDGYLLKMVIFHSYVSLPEGSANNIISIYLFMAILEKIYIYITIYLFIIFPRC